MMNEKLCTRLIRMPTGQIVSVARAMNEGDFQARAKCIGCEEGRVCDDYSEKKEE